MKKKLAAVLTGICLISVVAYANGGLTDTLGHILPGEVVRSLEKPDSIIQIGEKELSYHQKRKTKLTDAMNVRNGNVSDVCYVYLDEDQNVYTIDANGGNHQLRSFVSIQGEAAPAPDPDISQVDAAIAAAAALEIELEEGQLDSLNQAEYGYQLNFKMGKDPRIEDWVMVTLDWERRLSSLIVDNSGIESMDEVDLEFFDDAFAKYCKGRERQPKEVTVDYQRYGDAILARYSLTFEDEPPPGYDNGAVWVEMVSFVDKRKH